MISTATNGRFNVLLVAHDREENLGVRSIAAYLASFGVRAKIASLDDWSLSRVLRLVEVGNPEVVGFSLIFQRELQELAAVMKELRRNGVRVHFTVGGHFPTIVPELMLRLIPELDSVVRHEGEETLLALYRAIEGKRGFAAILGLAYRDRGRIRVNPPRPLIANLDTIPIPFRKRPLKRCRGFGVCTVTASRGCRHNCSFCSVQQFYGGAPGQKRRTRTPQKVADELETLFARGGRIFLFEDDDLGGGTPSQRRWLETFASELRARNLGDDILWRMSCRADEVDAELFAQLKEVGMSYVYMGIESGSSQGLRTANKGFEVDDVYRALKILRRLRLRYEYGFMLFDPDSSLETLTESVAFLGKAFGDGGAVVHYTKMVPYAGTPIARRLRSEGRLKGTASMPDYDFLDPRVGLLETFLSETFFAAFFDDMGIVRRLQALSFDSAVVERFLSDRCDAMRYDRSIRKIAMRFNRSSLETTQMACDFAARRTYEEVLDQWWALQFLGSQEKQIEAKLELDLDGLGIVDGSSETHDIRRCSS